MTELIKLAIKLFYSHRKLYLSCAVTISIVSILSSAQITLGLNLTNPNLVYIPEVSAEELRIQLIPIKGLLIFLGIILLFLSSFLIFSSIVQVVQLRSKEIELLRLVGASNAQIALLVASEVFMLSLLFGVPAALIGGFFSIPLSELLKQIGFFNEKVQLTFAYNFIQVLIVSAVVIFISTFSALFATLKVVTGTSSTKQSKRLSLFSILWRLTAAIGLLILFLNNDLNDYGEFFILLVPLIIVMICVFFSPLVIPLVSKTVGFIINGINPGTGLLLSKQGVKNAFRLSQYAVPTIICIGITGTFIVAGFPESEILYKEFRQSTNATSIFKTSSVAEADRVCEILIKRDNLCSRLASRAMVVSDMLEPLYFSDVQNNTELLNQNVTAGDISMVKGFSIASSDPDIKLGQKVKAHTLEGKQVTLTVVALINNPIYEGLFIEWKMHSIFGIKGTTIASVYLNSPTVFANSITWFEAKSVAKSINPSIKVLSRDQYAQELQDRRNANGFRGNIGMFGTIYIMSIVALLQLIISHEISRRNEIQQLYFLGVDNYNILLLGIFTVITTQLVALLLVLLILLIVAVRFSLMIGTSAMPAFVNALPFVTLSWVTILLFTLTAHMFATRNSMKMVRKNV